MTVNLLSREDMLLEMKLVVTKKNEDRLMT